jgi:hypothetical protein
MKNDPYKSPVVSFSFGPHTYDRAAGRPTTGHARPSTFQFKGQTYDAERVPWEVWKGMRTMFGTVPGWAFCRFGLRGRDGIQVLQMFGIVREPFGIYPAPFAVQQDTVKDIVVRNLSVLVHLPSASITGLFVSDAGAIMGSAIATSIGGGEFAADRTDGWGEIVDRVKAGWTSSGLEQMEDTCAFELTADDKPIFERALPIWSMVMPSDDQGNARLAS